MENSVNWGDSSYLGLFEVIRLIRVNRIKLGGYSSERMGRGTRADGNLPWGSSQCPLQKIKNKIKIKIKYFNRIISKTTSIIHIFPEASDNTESQHSHIAAVPHGSQNDSPLTMDSVALITL